MQAIQVLNNLNLDLRTFKMDLKPIRKQRSLSQNALYWLRFNVIEVETGQPSELLHNHYKSKFIFFQNDIRPDYAIVILRDRKSFTVMGKFLTEEVSTTYLDTKQFAAYCDLVCNDLEKETGIKLPDPADRNLDEIMHYYKEEIERLRQQ